MSLLGLDLNATRIRAVRGVLGDCPSTLPLAPPSEELPLVLNLQGRTPVVGVAGLRLCRSSPRLAWQNFLPQLGEPRPSTRKWLAPRARLDAAAALGLVFKQVAWFGRDSDGVVLALPPYLSGSQVEAVLTGADQAGLPVLGSIAAPLAAALTAHAEQSWTGTALVVDIDDQALTVTTIGNAQGQAQLHDVRSFPHLNRRAWQQRLLNALADCCILDSRWDPRESAATEQSLFDQLDGLLDAAQHGRALQMTLRTPQRLQNLILQPQDPAAFCGNLRCQAVAQVETLLASALSGGRPGAVLVTADAARMPGLAASLDACVRKVAPMVERPVKTNLSALEDFGSSLLDDEFGEAENVVLLTDGSTARGAHSVAAYFHRGDIPCGHLQAAAPLPLPQMRTTA